MTYIHDFSGKSISHDAFMALPSFEQKHYRPTLPRRRDSLAEDLIEIGIEAATLGIVLGSFAEDSNPGDSLDSSDSNQSGFNDGFGGGDYSGGGAGGDY